jgi:hypothetical protein
MSGQPRDPTPQKNAKQFDDEQKIEKKLKIG